MSDRLHDFARAVVTRQQEQQDRIDEEAVREVARDLGMTDEDLLAARAEGQARKQRAQTLRSQQLLDEAIAELEQAHAFNPVDLEATVMLADVLVKRGRKNDDAKDLERAKQLCKAALAAAPANTEAASILNTIQNNPAGERSRVPAGVIVGVVVALGAVAAVVVAILQML